MLLEVALAGGKSPDRGAHSHGGQRPPQSPCARGALTKDAQLTQCSDAPVALFHSA